MKEITLSELNIHPVTEISDGWMMLTAGCEDRGYNTMTCSWGHIGAIWGMGKRCPTTVCYVRPQRYTKQFMDREELYTLSFFPEGYKKQLGYLGSHSGRDEDKVAKVGLTPVFGDGFTYFQEAKLVLVCRKLYQSELKEEGFLDREMLEFNYPDRDLHTMYIGQIVKILAAE